MDLLDANILIVANNTYYPIDAVPEFWDWLEHHCRAGIVKVPSEIMDEIEAGGQIPGRDRLCDWLKQHGTRNALPRERNCRISPVPKSPDADDVVVQSERLNRKLLRVETLCLQQRYLPLLEMTSAPQQDDQSNVCNLPTAPHMPAA